MKLKLEMTPKRRMGVVFWLGSFQAWIWIAFWQDWRGKEEILRSLQEHWVEVHWGVWLAAWLVVLVLYIRNSSAFDKETLWMTIKNPAKVNREDDTMNTTQGPMGSAPRGTSINKLPGMPQPRQTPTMPKVKPPAKE